MAVPSSPETTPSMLPPQRSASKQQTTSLRLSTLARQLGPGAKLPTFTQLKQDLRVSVTTLSGVLDDLEAQGILFRRHGVGIYVSEKLLQQSVVLICDPSFFRAEGASPFWDILVEQARYRAAEKQEAFALHFSLPADENTAHSSAAPVALSEPLRADVRAGRVHGILGVGLAASTTCWLEEQNVPLVAFAGYAEHRVALDGTAAVHLGVAALAAQGCRRIGFWSPVSATRPPTPEQWNERPDFLHFREILARYGLVFEPALVQDSRHWIEPGAKRPIPSAQEQGRQAAQTVFAPGVDPALRPDGILCTEDTMMQGALPLLARLSVEVGRHVKIATHANKGSNILFGYEDVLTRLEVDPALLVNEMFRLLSNLMDGREPETPVVTIPPTVRLPETAPSS